jgi:hypothetical protein
MTRRIFSMNGRGRIVGRRLASGLIGAGGNYRQGRTRLAGKIEGSGRPAKLRKRGQYLQFTAGPSTGPQNDRTELAWLPYLPLSRDVLIEWDMRVPSGTPPVRAFQTPLQLWQTEPGRIYAPRFRPGTSTTLDFPGAGTAQLRPDRWHSLSMRVSASSLTATIDGRTIGTTPQPLPPRAPYPDDYRIKFGIYRNFAPVEAETHFGNMQVSYL